MLALMIANHNNKQIAELLNIDYKTAHTHRASIMRKLGMNNSQVMNKRSSICFDAKHIKCADDQSKTDN